MTKLIDYSQPYPTMHSDLPQIIVRRYRQKMFELGFYPQSGRVRGFPDSSSKTGQDKDVLQEEIDKNYFAELGKKLGVDPEVLPLASDEGPGVKRGGSGPRPSRRDPQSVGFLARHFVRTHGWTRAFELENIREHWADYVGSDVAAHCRLESVSGERLVVRTSSTAWATQMKFLLPTLERQLAQRLGSGNVPQIIIRGPAAPSWKHGSRSVPGRGPRDTYG